MTEIEKLIARLEYLSSPTAEREPDGARLTSFVRCGDEAATALRAMQAETERLRGERDARIEPEIVDQMLDIAEPIMAEALAAETERADAAEATVATLTAQVEAMRVAIGITAAQALKDEIPSGYVPKASADWHAGYDAAIRHARKVVTALTTEKTNG